MSYLTFLWLIFRLLIKYHHEYCDDCHVHDLNGLCAKSYEGPIWFGTFVRHLRVVFSQPLWRYFLTKKIKLQKIKIHVWVMLEQCSQVILVKFRQFLKILSPKSPRYNMARNRQIRHKFARFRGKIANIWAKKRLIFMKNSQICAKLALFHENFAKSRILAIWLQKDSNFAGDSGKFLSPS